MESKKTENATGTKVNGESKIPKSIKYPPVKETNSKTSIEKKTALSSKTATKMATTTTSKLKQTQITKVSKNVKRMSVAKISNDVMNLFQDENLKSDDHAIESTADIKVLDTENAIKRAPLRDRLSQAAQKQPGNLPKRASAPDLKQCTAFGGIRFTKKRNTCPKFDMFQKMAKESKDSEATNPLEPSNRKLKRSTSAKTNEIKEIDWSNEKNLDYLPAVIKESSKEATLTVKQTTLKKCAAFGGIRFKPKWSSTPLKPDLFENVQKVSKPDKGVCPPDASVKRHETIPNSAKAITNEVETITIDETTIDEIAQVPTKDTKCMKLATITVKELDKIYPAFAGMRLTPKRKSTHPKPDMFEKVQESKTHDQEADSPVTSSEMKISNGATNEMLKTETQFFHVETVEKTSTQNAQCLETVSITVKETSQVSAFGGIRFAPKWKSTPIRPSMFESIQRESKADRLEVYTTDSSSKEVKATTASTMAKIKVETDDEKLEVLKTQKPESSKIEAAKNEKKVIPPAFGGLRFKPRQKKLHNLF